MIEGARRVRLELAADWLVMAAWLTWLKSRLLLPEGSEAADEAEIAADMLAARLRDLQAIRAGAVWLGARPLLGPTFSHAARLRITPRSTARGWRSTWLPWSGRTFWRCGDGAGTRRYRPRPLTLWSVTDALRRLAALLGSVPDWTSLDHFLPDTLAGPLERRAALASTLLAGLELARSGEPAAPGT